MARGSNDQMDNTLLKMIMETDQNKAVTLLKVNGMKMVRSLMFGLT